MENQADYLNNETKNKIEGLKKEFDLAVILSLTTGRKYVDDVHDIFGLVNHLTHFAQLTYKDVTNKELGEFVLSQHPQLRGVGKNEEFTGTNEEINKAVADFIRQKKFEYGETLPIRPMTKDDIFFIKDAPQEEVEESKKMN